MKTTRQLITAMLTIVTLPFAANSELVKLVAVGTPTTPASTQLQLSTNQTASLAYSFLYYSGTALNSIDIITDGTSFTLFSSGSSSGYAVANPPIIVGPAIIRLNASVNTNATPGFTNIAYCVFNVQFPGLQSQIPNNTVVIPADTNGPVSIILESSTDLVTWVAANPGTYGTSTQNRFFRVRAQR